MMRSHSQDDWYKVYNLGQSCQQQQQWEQAAVAFQKAIALQPDFFWSYHHLGDTLSKLEQWQQASLAYSRGLKIDPSFFWSWHNLGNALTNLQQWRQASLAYSHAVEIDSSFFESWHNLGNALINLQQWDKAIAIYLQAIQLQPEHKLVYQKIGTAFKQRGSLEESIQAYRRLIKSPRSGHIFKDLSTKPQILLNIGDRLVNEHQINAAIALYYMVLEIQPDRTQILIKLAELLQQQNQLQQDITSRQELLTRQKNIAAKPYALKHSLSVTKRERTFVCPHLPLEPLKNIPGQIVIKTNNSVSPNKLEELCSAVGWSPRPIDKVKQSLENSFCHIAAWHFHDEQQQLIGFARAVSDGAFHAALLDILVHPDFQNRGLGKRIVKALIEQLQESEVQNITLVASPHIVDFYHKLGFVSQPNNLQWMLWCGD